MHMRASHVSLDKQFRLGERRLPAFENADSQGTAEEGIAKKSRAILDNAG